MTIQDAMSNEDLISCESVLSKSCSSDKMIDNLSEDKNQRVSSHKNRWTAEEDALFLSGLQLYGYGNWTPISVYIKTRNIRQCKDHGRAWIRSGKIKNQVIPTPLETQSEDKISLSIETEIKAEAEIDTYIKTEEEAEVETKTEIFENDVREQSTQEIISDIKTTIVKGPFEQLKSKDKVSFEGDTITAQEKKKNPEWFENKPSKTPERYLKIRNFILSEWETINPTYLTKIHARKGLKGCGDVNAIGRVHSYLEEVGAINVNCVATAKPPQATRRPVRKTFKSEDLYEEASQTRLKRKAQHEPGYCDRDTDSQLPTKTGDKVRPKRVIKRPEHYHDPGSFRDYDPFQLVPVGYHTDYYPAPFVVEIQNQALLVMDFHAHLAYTEIIGLMGGSFVEEDGVKKLKVSAVFPCQSVSTGIQCEMNPESEMEAREVFAQKQLSVVGWYHSHPTFEPHPSIRDIENQTVYQTLFRSENGDEPFIGVIITPYDPENLTDISKIEYLHISKQWSSAHTYRIPFACRRKVIQSQLNDETMGQLEKLVEDFKNYEHKINMSSEFGQKSRLEKLLGSLEMHIELEDKKEQKAFMDKIRLLVTTVFDSALQTDVKKNRESLKLSVTFEQPSTIESLGVLE
ncbi:Homeodomain-like DNA binding domain-containing transcription factor [Phycomyces blakesleeanus]